MSIFLVLIAVVVCGALLWMGVKVIKNKTQSQIPAGIVSLKPEDWSILFGAKMPPHPQIVSNGAWFFDFPNSDGVHYILTSFTPKQSPTSITMTFKIAGNGVFTCPSDGGQLPPSVRFMVGYRSLAGRWWSNPISYKLAATDSTTITTSFQPDRWSNVNGKFGSDFPEDFRSDIDNIKVVGMTFGGGNSFGHGVWLKSGAAKFTLLDYKIT